MELPGKATIKKAEERVVPDDLMQELHKANEQFHSAKRAVEQTMADPQEQHQQRVDAANDQLREAERRVEEINLRIHANLKPPPAQ
jgi:methylphosphotriester-DNA--protein-cysteine methyltransferase